MYGVLWGEGRKTLEAGVVGGMRSHGASLLLVASGQRRDLHLAPSLSQPRALTNYIVSKATGNYMCSLDPFIYAGLLSSCYHIMVGAKEVFSNDRTRMISRIKTVQLKKGKKWPWPD